MTDDTITRIVETEDKSAPIGRQADRLAMGLAGLGAALSIIAAIWFFLGFAENDTRPEHLFSAFVLTSLLFVFAIAPFILVTLFAHRAFKSGSRRSHQIWTLFLMLPWIALGLIAVSYTPLPVWSGIIMALLATLLSLWAFVSLILDWNVQTPENTSNTEPSQENEMPNATE